MNRVAADVSPLHLPTHNSEPARVKSEFSPLPDPAKQSSALSAKHQRHKGIY